MIKYALMAVAAAAVIGIGWPLASAAFGGGPNEATRLVEATSRTNNKAESLNDSFTDVIPPAPRRANPQENLAPGGFAPAPDPQAGGQQNPGEAPQPSPTPDKVRSV